MYNEKAVIFYNGNRYICPVLNGAIVTEEEIYNGRRTTNHLEFPFQKIPDIMEIREDKFMSMTTIIKTDDAIVLGCDSGDKDNDFQRYYYDVSRGIAAVFSGSEYIQSNIKTDAHDLRVLDFIADFVAELEKNDFFLFVNCEFKKKYSNYNFKDVKIIIAFNTYRTVLLITNGYKTHQLSYDDINEEFRSYGDLLINGRSIQEHCDMSNCYTDTNNAVEFSKRYLKTVDDVYSALRANLGTGYVSPVKRPLHTLVLYDNGNIKLDDVSV